MKQLFVFDLNSLRIDTGVSIHCNKLYQFSLTLTIKKEMCSRKSFSFLTQQMSLIKNRKVEKYWV